MVFMLIGLQVGCDSNIVVCRTDILLGKRFVVCTTRELIPIQLKGVGRKV